MAFEQGFAEGTTRFSSKNVSAQDCLNITVIDAERQPYTVCLDNFGKSVVTFGRREDNDLVLTSNIVSRAHGTFRKIGNEWYIYDENSANGLICNSRMIQSRKLFNGDIIRIDDGIETIKQGVLFVFSSTSEQASTWNCMPLGGRNSITIGRSQNCSIVLPHVSVSRVHAEIVFENGTFSLIDKGSTNGVLVNGQQVLGKKVLHEKDVITITTSKLIFTSNAIFFTTDRNGMTVDASDVVIERKSGSKKFITCNHVSLNICPGELVAIIGGSGAGKSTVMNAMSGYLPPSAGNVYINGNNLYDNIDSLKKIIGYVPQQDIVYNNLTVYDMLKYTAKLRLPDDTTEAEREAAIAKALEIVDMTEKKNSMISALSGGQKKRASIAVELLPDPNLIFLDEPSSGLDPGTERSLMESLRKMANSGKTVILVTHSTLQLKMCDKVVFMGKGGNLCYFGPFNEALKFFNVDDVVDVYALITDHAPDWAQKYRQISGVSAMSKQPSKIGSKEKKSRFKQLSILSARYSKLILNDKQRLILLFGQAPLLALLISLVKPDDGYDTFQIQNVMFALACAAFWIGMLNSIQEVCKERTILRREYMTGLSLTSYIGSKITVLGLMCLIQSLMVCGVFALTVGLSENSLIIGPFFELFMSTLLTSLAAASMGIFVSCLFSNADRAMTVAPILLMPQILFSGLIFELEGGLKVLSWIIITHWSLDAFGSAIDVDTLLTASPMAENESLYVFKSGHLLLDWGILILMSVVFLGLARLALQRIAKEKS